MQNIYKKFLFHFLNIYCFLTGRPNVNFYQRPFIMVSLFKRQYLEREKIFTQNFIKKFTNKDYILGQDYILDVVATR